MTAAGGSGGVGISWVIDSVDGAGTSVRELVLMPVSNTIRCFRVATWLSVLLMEANGELVGAGF
jgi:hypothetical protein